MRKLITIYTRSCKRFDTRGRRWRDYVVDVLVIVGIPLSLFICITAILVAAGIGSVEVDGKTLAGRDAIIPGLVAAFCVLPGCAFIGTIAYVLHEKMGVR